MNEDNLFEELAIGDLKKLASKLQQQWNKEMTQVQKAMTDMDITDIDIARIDPSRSKAIQQELIAVQNKIMNFYSTQANNQNKLE